MLEPKQNEWVMIYRKMIEESDERFVLTLLRREKEQGKVDHNVKLTLFAISTGTQDVFVFTEREVLSNEQLEQLRLKKLDIKVIFKNAIDARLRIKMLQSNIGNERIAKPSLMAFFVNPALLEIPKPKEHGGMQNRRQGSMVPQQKAAEVRPDREIDEPANQLFNEIGNFDIRRGVCNNLLNPDPGLNIVGSTTAQRSLIGQYEQDSVLFDVYQDLDPFELKLRVNAFDKENFKMLSSAAMDAANLRSYLKRDKKSFLIEA